MSACLTYLDFFSITAQVRSIFYFIVAAYKYIILFFIFQRDVFIRIQFYCLNKVLHSSRNETRKLIGGERGADEYSFIQLCPTQYLSKFTVTCY